MNRFKVFRSLILSVSVLGSLFVLTGCKEDFSDGEIRGILTVDKAQYGNDKLEVNDMDSKMTRFIYPGRKILKIDQGLSSTDIFIFESGMAKLARIAIPTSLIKTKEDKSFCVLRQKMICLLSF